MLLLIVLALPVFESAGSRRARLGTAAAGLAAYAVALAVLWLGARQSLAEVPQYLADSVQLVLGYPAAVAIEQPGRGAEYVYGGAAALGIALLALLEGRSLPLPRRWVLVLLLAAYVGLLFRHGFTRHDEHSLFAFFAPVLVAAVALVRPGRRMVAAGVAIPLVLGCLSQRDASDLFRVNPDRAIDSARFLLSADTRSSIRHANRMIFRLRHAVPAEALARIGAAPVHIDLSETSVAWAYPRVNWRPLPVLQSWNAYTTRLDDKNADFLASGSAPRYVLWRAQTGASDRNGRLDSPSAMGELLCRYRQEGAYESWLLLERVPRRCGAPVGLGAETAAFGRPVSVPTGGSRPNMVVARFTEVDQPLSQTVAGLLLKPQVVHIGLGQGRVSRFLTGNAGSLHVLRVPSCLGYDSTLFDSTPYETVALARGDPRIAAAGGPEQSGSFEVRFFSVPFRC